MMHRSRRAFLKTTTLATGAATLACASLALAAKPNAKRPNLLFILADDMGWPDLACYGHAFHETPVLDRLAAQGMKFTSFYAAPVCSPTRSTIQTGQYTARTGITDFIPGHWRPFEKLIVPPIEHELKEGIVTPGGALKAAGYTTGHFGKWHLGGQPDQFGYAKTERQLDPDFQKHYRQKNQGPKKIDYLTDAAIDFIEQNQSKPFFLTISHYAVHIPLEAREATTEKYHAKQKPKKGINNPTNAAMTENLDSSIGRILATLDKHGLDDNTIVVFASDNGGLRLPYFGLGNVVSTNTPLRDEKGTLYEGGVRVPLIVRWPGIVKPASVCDTPTMTADLLPTFCAMVGAATPKQPTDGLSIVPLLEDPDAALQRKAIYFHYPHYHHSRPAGAIRAGDWKLIEFFEEDALELYNLKDDIGEGENLADDRPDLAKRLQLLLAAWRERIGARMPTKNPKHDPARAHEWWSRRTGKPLDMESLRKRYGGRTLTPNPGP